MSQMFRWSPDASPMSRDVIDSGTPLTRILGGILFLGYSWVSTTVLLTWLLSPKTFLAFVASPSVELASDLLIAVGIAFGFAIGVSIVEFVTAERSKLGYNLTLWLGDVPFSAALTFIGLVLVLRQHFEPVPVLAYIPAAIVSIVWGWATAKFGEMLLFGKRRQRQPAYVR